MVYRILGKLLWQNRLSHTDIVIIHRGAPGDKRTIPGNTVKEIKKGYFVYENPNNGEVHIPLHRILEVRIDGKPIWKRSPKT